MYRRRKWQQEQIRLRKAMKNKRRKNYILAQGDLVHCTKISLFTITLVDRNVCRGYTAYIRINKGGVS